MSESSIKDLHKRIRELEKSLETACISHDETNEYLRMIADTIPAIIVTVNADERYLYVNEYFKILFNRSQQDIIGKTIKEVIGDKNYGNIKKRIARVLSGHRVPYEGDVLDASGNIHHMKGEYIPRFDKDNNIAGFFAFSHDITEHVRNAAALMESEERYRNLFYSAGYAIFILSDNRIVECNSEALKMFDSSQEEFIDKTPFDFSPLMQPDGIDSREKGEEFISQALKGDSVLFEWRHKRFDGVEFDAEVILWRVDSKGKQLNAIIRDVTERKQAEQQLHESRERFRELFDRMGDGVAVYTAVDDGEDFIFKDLNHAGQRLSKVNKLDIIGRSVQDVFPGIVKMGLLDVFRRVWRTGNPEHHPISLYEDSFLTEWVENYVYKLSTGELVAVYDDVTDRKLAENALAAEKERLAVTLRSIGDAVIATDMLGHIILMNPVAESLTGWIQEDALDKPLQKIFRIFNENTRKICENPVQKVLAHGKVEQLENHTVLIAKDGTERIIADSGAPIMNDSGNIIGVVLVFRDITHAQRIEDELMKAQKLESIGVLAGGIAHDFNNILAAILGNISIMKSTKTHADDEFQMLEDAEKACFQAKNLTRQLLTFSKGGNPVKQVTEITEIIRDSVKFALRGSNVKCNLLFADNVWHADVDRGQIGQVMNNIVINANQAMPDGGEITVRVENCSVSDTDTLPLNDGKYIMISVEDTGIGIHENNLAKIFDPYYSTKSKGSGLGLTTAYSIVHHHDGYITVKSKHGDGTVFEIYLPASPEKKVPPQRHTSHSEQKSGRVLVMDDEQMVRNVAVRMLSLLGNEVETASDGVDAIEKYTAARKAGYPFDVVIMDLTIPGGMGGAETIKNILPIDPDVRAIVTSGYSNDPVISQYAFHGFKGYLLKPFNINDLKKIMNDVLSETS